MEQTHSHSVVYVNDVPISHNFTMKVWNWDISRSPLLCELGGVFFMRDGPRGDQ